MKDRAQRRQAREKALKKAIELTHMYPYNMWKSEEERLLWAYRTFKHPARCSCPGCGNPRKYTKGDYKLTLAERKNKLDFEE